MTALILSALVLLLAITWAAAIERAEMRKRVALEPVMLLPRAIGIPTAHRKRVGWWM